MSAFSVRTSAALKTLLTNASIVLSAMFATSAIATPLPVSTIDARQVINEYRELRASCAQLQGITQKTCYSRLHSTTASYQRAKRQIHQTDPNAILLSRR